jgi:hypothetical protein
MFLERQCNIPVQSCDPLYLVVMVIVCLLKVTIISQSNVVAWQFQALRVRLCNVSIQLEVELIAVV